MLIVAHNAEHRTHFVPYTAFSQTLQYAERHTSEQIALHKIGYETSFSAKNRLLYIPKTYSNHLMVIVVIDGQQYFWTDKFKAYCEAYAYDSYHTKSYPD
jgi:hypothetical protein